MKIKIFEFSSDPRDFAKLLQMRQNTLIFIRLTNAELE